MCLPVKFIVLLLHGLVKPDPVPHKLVGVFVYDKELVEHDLAHADLAISD